MFPTKTHHPSKRNSPPFENAMFDTALTVGNPASLTGISPHEAPLKSPRPRRLAPPLAISQAGDELLKLLSYRK